MRIAGRRFILRVWMYKNCEKSYFKRDNLMCLLLNSLIYIQSVRKPNKSVIPNCFEISVALFLPLLLNPSPVFFLLLWICAFWSSYSLITLLYISDVKNNKRCKASVRCQFNVLLFVSTIEMIFIQMFVGGWLSGILGRSKSVVRLISARETIYEVFGHKWNTWNE